MWQPLLKILEMLSRLRVPVWRSISRVRVGDPEALDVEGGGRWQEFREAEKLFDLWGPVPGSPWEPFHCVTLFAAIDTIPRGDLGPTSREEAFFIDGQGIGRRPEEASRGGPPSWSGPDCLVVVDLPGPRAVAVGTQFVAAGFQPVCTFDHWPNPSGLLRPEGILAELFRQVPRVADSRNRLTRQSPPVWICDEERLGTRPGRPREFDNRYYLDDSLLPGPDLLRRAGIERVVCVVARPGGSLVVDLQSYLADLRTKGLKIFAASFEDPETTLTAIQPTRPREVPAVGGISPQRSRGLRQARSRAVLERQLIVSPPQHRRPRRGSDFSPQITGRGAEGRGTFPFQPSPADWVRARHRPSQVESDGAEGKPAGHSAG